MGGRPGRDSKRVSCVCGWRGCRKFHHEESDLFKARRTGDGSPNGFGTCPRCQQPVHPEPTMWERKLARAKRELLRTTPSKG